MVQQQDYESSVRDHLGRPLGVTVWVNNFGQGVAVWVHPSVWVEREQVWQLLPATGEPGSVGRPHTFRSVADAELWGQNKAAELLALVELKTEGVLRDGETPSSAAETAKALGVPSLKQLSADSGIQYQTLLNWYKNRYAAFDMLCRGWSAKHAAE
jgi:hypothetical protein